MICTACGGTTFDTEGVCLRCGTPIATSSVATLDSASTDAPIDNAAMPVDDAPAPNSADLPEPLPSTAPRNPPPVTVKEDPSAASTQPPQIMASPNAAAPEPTPAPRRTSVSVPVASPEDPSSTNPSRGTYCGRCGSAVDPAADFCGICGNPMNEATMQRMRTARSRVPSAPAVSTSTIMTAPAHSLQRSMPSSSPPWLVIVAVAAIVVIGLAVGLLLAHVY